MSNLTNVLLPSQKDQKKCGYKLERASVGDSDVSSEKREQKVHVGMSRLCFSYAHFSVGQVTFCREEEDPTAQFVAIG